MRLDEEECWARLTASDHGVLGTVHPRRGVDVVPVVFALDEGERRIVIPIDTVKPKQGRRLQRLANIEHDPRCVLMVDHYDDDWSQLWWVRLHGRAVEAEPTDEALALLRRRYPDYSGAEAVSSTIVLTADEITGWSWR